MSDTKKPWREWYVEFGGYPNIDDKENYKRYVGAEKFDPISPSDEVIHVIEIGAVEALEARIKDLRAGLEFYGNLYGDNWYKLAMDTKPGFATITRDDVDCGIGGKRAREALEQDNKARGDENDT